MDVGSHCAKSDCQQVDFLPFTCDCCASVFCLAHRSYDSHECPNAGSRDRRVVECPLCKQLIRWTLEQDVNAVWEQHVRGGQCIPQADRVGPNGKLEPEKKKPKARCGADKCRQVLLTSNTFHCSKCGLDVCLRHRFEGDHDCQGIRDRRRQQRAAAFSRPVNSATLQQNARAAATSVVNGTMSAVNTIVQKTKPVANNTSSNDEECPICHQKFHYVAQLIAHVTRAHPETNNTRASSSTSTPAVASSTVAMGSSTNSEVCPQCHGQFRDVAALIHHVETAHSRDAAVAAGRSGDEKCLVM